MAELMQFVERNTFFCVFVVIILAALIEQCVHHIAYHFGTRNKDE